jgi:hypothetical protein
MQHMAKKRQSRAGRKKQQKLGKRPSPRVVINQSPPPDIQRRPLQGCRGCFVGLWKWVGAFGLLFGILTAGYVFQPNVTVTAEDPLRPADMLSTPFTVRNEGTTAIRNVRFVCQVDTLVTSELQFVQNNRVTERLLVDELPRGESVSGGCWLPNFSGNIIGRSGHQELIRLSIEVSFRHTPINLPARTRAGFRTAPGFGGRLRWTHQRAIKIWTPQQRRYW